MSYGTHVMSRVDVNAKKLFLRVTGGLRSRSDLRARKQNVEPSCDHHHVTHFKTVLMKKMLFLALFTFAVAI